MSISTIQEKFFNKGCGSVLAVGAALLMGIGVFSQCNNAAAMQDRNGQSAVATVEGIPISAEAIGLQANRVLESNMGGGDDVSSKATAYAIATHTAVRAAAIHALIEKEGAVSDAEVKSAAENVAAQQIDQLKGRLLMEGKVKPNASDADFDKAFGAENGGKTLTDLRNNNVVTFTDAYKDATKKDSVLQILGDQILIARYGSKAVANDQALRDSFKLYNVKRIFFSAQSGAKETPDARAQKALADLKTGKSFDQLMDSVSNDPPAPGKPLHDTTSAMPSQLLDRQAELATLKGKPLLTTTGIVDVPGGKAIYELASIQDSTPPDFDKNKDKYRRQKAEEVGRPELEAKLNAIVNSDAVKWSHQGYHALAAVADVISQPATMNETTLGKALKIAEDATHSNDPDEKQKGAMAMLAASSLLETQQNADPAKTKAIQLTALEAAAAANLQDSSTNLKLADLYGEAKNGAKATEALLTASKSNARYDAPGETVFRQIVDKSLKFEKDKIITKEQLESIQAQQALWSDAHTASLKADAEAKAEIDRQKKANEEEIAKQKKEAGVKGASDDAANKKANEAEIAKQKAEAEKAAKPATTPTAPAPTGGKAPQGKP